MLYGIGAMEHDKQKDKDTLAYQELVTAPLDWAFDEDDDGIDEGNKSDKENEDLAVTVKFAIEKVSNHHASSKSWLLMFLISFVRLFKL